MRLYTRSRFPWRRSAGLHFVRVLCIALAVSVVQVPAAQSPAVIRNRALVPGAGKEVDAAVKVLAVDARPISGASAEVDVAPGRHIIKILCTARVLAGMGTVDFESKSEIAMTAESGRIYQLDGIATVRGECRPVLQ